jgi:hypothetical protein
MTLGFMILHNLLDFLAKLIRRGRDTNQRASHAHESKLPHRALGRDSQLPDAGLHWLRAEIS